MNAQEQERFDSLHRGSCVPITYIRDYYGLPWPLTEHVRADFEVWQRQRGRRRGCAEGAASRYDLEEFMQQKDVMPKKWMAARLGMRVASLDELLARLTDLGMRPQRYAVYADLIAASLSDDLVPTLPGLKFRTFSDHNSFCERLHAEIDKVLGIKVQPLFCETSERLEDYPRQFASNFDCITLAPLSARHQLWLDFRKPLNLGPDRCSKLFYVENRDALRPYCAGTQEPDDLDGYLVLLARQGGG